MPQLTDTQSLLLATAAQRDSGSLLPLPASITAPAGGVAKSLASLVKKGLAEARQTSVADEAHRTEDDTRFGLFVTLAGLAAIGIDDAPGEHGGAAAASPAPMTTTAAAPRATKVSAVLALLGRESGATLPELVDATGWLPHTTRAALTGLRKKGHGIERYKRDDVTCYRIESAA